MRNCMAKVSVDMTQTGHKKTHEQREKSVATFTFISEVQTIAPAFTMGLWGLSAKNQVLS